MVQVILLPVPLTSKVPLLLVKVNVVPLKTKVKKNDKQKEIFKRVSVGCSQPGA